MTEILSGRRRAATVHVSRPRGNTRSSSRVKHRLREGSEAAFIPAVDDATADRPEQRGELLVGERPLVDRRERERADAIPGE
jgi:hypothetical protein